MRIITLTAEHQSLFRVSCLGRHIANCATDQRLARQTSVYGGFFQAFRCLTAELFPPDAARSIINADLDISDPDGFCDQLAQLDLDDIKVVLL